jgi:SCP-2 sterol transfer family
MARFLTPEWVEQVNVSLQGVPLADPGPDAGLAMSDGRVVVVQEVHGTPDGDVRLVMTIDAGRVHLGLDTADHSGGAGADGGSPAGDPNVTIVVAYPDAAAMSQGQLTPAEALNAGRIRVRGDLAALAASQQVLHDARSAAGEALPPTTY